MNEAVSHAIDDIDFEGCRDPHVIVEAACDEFALIYGEDVGDRIRSIAVESLRYHFEKDIHTQITHVLFVIRRAKVPEDGLMVSLLKAAVSRVKDKIRGRISRNLIR